MLYEYLLAFLGVIVFINNLINKAMGVTTKKKIIPIIIGEIIFPKSRPNLNQILFNGFNSFELNNPNAKKQLR